MNLPVLVFTILSALLFCVLSIVVVRLAFDRVATHASRAVTGVLLLVACAIYWGITVYQEKSLAAEIHRNSCSENLSTIHEKSLEYLRSEGSSPANLRELVRRSDLNSAQLVCPSTGAEYHYEAGALERPGRILCYDPAPHRFEVFWYVKLHRHVLFSDGRVEWLGESAFSELFHAEEGD